MPLSKSKYSWRKIVHLTHKQIAFKRRRVTFMQKTIVYNCGSAVLKETGILVATLLVLLPTFAHDSSTANAVKVDDSAKSSGTQVKSYEQKTNTRRSLRAAANQMQQAAQKDRTQTSPLKHTGSIATSPAPSAVTSLSRSKQKSKATVH